MLDDRLVSLELKKALIEVMPEVLEAAMKPVEKIKDIRIIDMGNGAIGGLNGHGGGNGSNGKALPGARGGGTLPDNIVQALMSYRMQAPLVGELLSELGFEPKQGLGRHAAKPLGRHRRGRAGGRHTGQKGQAHRQRGSQAGRQCQGRQKQRPRQQGLTGRVIETGMARPVAGRFPCGKRPQV